MYLKYMPVFSKIIKGEYTMNYRSALFATMALAGTINSGNLLASVDGGYQIGVGIGALQGIAVHAGYRFSDSDFLNNKFGTRLEYSTLSFTFDKEERKNKPSFEFFAKGHQMGALIDFYPFAGIWVLGAFRFSAGYYAGKFEMGNRKSEEFGTGRTVKLNKKDYTLKGRVNLEAKLKSKATGPYLGTGFDMGLFYGLKFFADAGIVFTEKPKVNVSLSGTGSVEWNDGTLQTANLNNPADIAKINKVANDMAKNYEEENFKKLYKPFYPIAKIGLLYRF